MPNTNTTLTDLFEDIADAIRGKDGTSAQITASDFPTRITAIPSGGGGVPAEALVISGNCAYRFYNNNWNWFIETYGNQISTQNISNCSSMFYNTNVSIPFALNISASKTNALDHYQGTTTPIINLSLSSTDLTNMFRNCEKLSDISTVYLPTGFQPENLGGIFKYCYKLKQLPTWFVDLDLSIINANSRDITSSFEECSELKTIPTTLLNKYYSPNTINSTLCYRNLFSGCSLLDETVGIFPVDITGGGSGLFRSTFAYNSRLKRLIFATDNGTPYIRRWKNVTINLCENTNSKGIGYFVGVPSTLDLSDYVEVSDSTTYNLYKNESNWYTEQVGYSRFNHDSAVELINSLPDTSAYISTAGGTNTIKMEGASGSLTDGGAINTLTTAEIAVATAKGWTVTLI